jgi:hypothetical protein
MVMYAGWSFWHEERTLPDDPHLRMLQIFIRPHTIDLGPRIQHGPLTAPEPNNVFTGEIEINGARFRRSGEWSCDKAGGLTVRATRPSLLVAFLINPDAEVTREGTIGR